MIKRLYLILLLILCFAINSSAIGPAMQQLLSGTGDSCSSFQENFTRYTDGSVLNTAEWDTVLDTPTGVFRVYSGSLYFNAEGVSAGEYKSIWQLDGDFDITIDFTVTTIDNPTSLTNRAAEFYVVDTGSWYICITRYKASGGNDGYYAIATSDAGAGYAKADASGKLRLTRVSSTITGYEWDTGDGRWEWNNNAAGKVFTDSGTDPVEVVIKARATSDTVVSNIDNFTIISGTCQWP